MKRKSFSCDIANSKVTRKELRARLARYNVAVSAELAEKILRTVELLLRWNEKMNLTAICEPGQIVDRHFGEAFFAAKSVPILEGHLVDVGSGSGFPAVPIKLFVPGVAVTLVESSQRKCAFLAELVRQLQLARVEIVNGRFESLEPEKFSADYITCRAVGQLERLLPWCVRALVPGGRVVLWLVRKDAERLKQERDWLWQNLLWIPGSRERLILVGVPRGGEQALGGRCFMRNSST